MDRRLATVRFGLPHDPAQWAALLGATVVVALAPHLSRRPRWAVPALAAVATALSVLYVDHYLRGGPRIIDATSYYLEARAIARGLFAWPLAEPTASTMGRFLVRSSTDASQVAVLFPPGWPTVLALGFITGAPMAVGPLLAAALVFATASLASRATALPSARTIALIAATFSVLCAALRYHTADTMSHGLAALCLTLSLALTFRALDRAAAAVRWLPSAVAAGFALGWLFATRPVSSGAAALGVSMAILASSTPIPRAKLAAAIGAGALPGVLLFLWQQRVVTGALGKSSQALYYALADGPPGCFRYGFGQGIGCVGEHGEFVSARLHDGFGALAALGTTVRRLWMHLADPLNAEPLFLLVLAGAWLGRRTPRLRILVACLILQVLAYAPFYFDGNYPGGGARFYAELLPLEHVLAALAVIELASLGASGVGRARWVGASLALVLVGFSVRVGFDHAQLRDREGGRPMFEPQRLASAGVTHGLVFLDTDHGYNLALDPQPGAPIEVARWRGDGLDRLVWQARGRPPAYRYTYALSGREIGSVGIEFLHFDEGPQAFAIEGESLWPVEAQHGAFALPEPASATCASAARVLRVRRGAPSGDASVDVELPARLLRGARVTPRLALGPGAAARVTFTSGRLGDRRDEVVEGPRDGALECRPGPTFTVATDAARLTLRVAPLGRSNTVIALDRVDVDVEPTRAQ